MTRLDPIETSRRIDDSFLGYLISTYGPRRADLRADFEKVLKESRLMSRGPYLQATPPFATGRSTRQLVDEGILSSGFEQLASTFPLDRPLHLHQEQAIEKAVLHERNLVVSTGTGSGKTEAFLLPVLNHLFYEQEAGTIGRPGVRALLLYPMNALANDQVKRLRQLLTPVPHITFGRYTGETKKSQSEAEEDFGERFPGATLLSNELISREAMQAGPPHLLLTNYAMLEYLLLRPEDTPFFDGQTSQDWRFIVLDEAHVYNGAQGTEIAYLLRRLRDRVINSRRGQLKCFALSATLGRGVEDHPALVEFASDLFDERFEWDSYDPIRQDVVNATRVEFGTVRDATHRLTSAQINELHSAFRAGSPVSELFARAGVQQLIQPTDTSAALHQILQGDANLLKTQQALATQSRETRELATTLFPGDSEAELRLVQLVDLAVNAREEGGDLPLLPARFHHFVRSLEGGYVCLHPNHPSSAPRIDLLRHNHCTACRDLGQESFLFELATCRRCRTEYVVGVPTDESGIKRLKRANDFESSRRYFLLGEAVGDSDDDEETTIDQDGNPIGAANVAGAVELCAGCGAVTDVAGVCACSGHRINAVAIDPPSDSGGAIRSCASCSGRTGEEVITRFVTGTDAPLTVIATELYQQLPPSNEAGAAEQIGNGRKLLTFSDSRQDAAFFAGYLERTYGRSLHRALMLDAVESSRDPLRTPDVVDSVLRTAERSLILDPDKGRVANRAIVAGWTTEELLAIDRRQSLEGTGQLRISIALPRRYQTPTAFTRLGLSEKEADSLVQLLVGSLRTGCAITMLDGVDIRAEEFAPRNREVSVRGEGGEHKRHVLGWSPTAPSKNRRFDLLEKVLHRTGQQVDPRELLKRFWVDLTDATGPWNSVMVGGSDRRLGTTWRLAVDRFEFHASTELPGPFRCGRCHELTWWNVAGVCPAWRCSGTVEPVRSSDLAGDHYANLYQRLKPIALEAREHTAQWTAQEASNVQEKFIGGDVNVLSCSTTFEMGVDVGDLQAVLLRNVPPAVANYVQRAGRAGRRTDSAALVVTFAQRRNHDRTFYRNPARLIDGHITPPAILLANVHIARRHMHSVAFAQYMRQCVINGAPVAKSVGEFFIADNPTQRAESDAFTDWLRSRPPDLQKALMRLLPEPVADATEVATWNWISALLDPDREDPIEGWFARAVDEARTEVDHLAQLRAEALGSEDGKALERYKAIERTLRRRPLIGYLSSRNVLPKYGFPVDVVELNLRGSGKALAGKLELDRDLALAIADYAPGNQVVAGKTKWRSSGLAKRPDQSWPSYGWGVCGDCRAFRRALAERPAECHVCGSTKLAPGSAGTFAVPIFGFVGRAVAESGESRPPKKGFAQPYFTTDEDAEFLPVEGLRGRMGITTRVSRQGRITLINQGAGAGYRICERCGGYGDTGSGAKQKKEHDDPRSPARKCSGPLRTLSLGHEFLTDVMELRLDGDFGYEESQAVLYALIESAGEIGINRDEVDGTTYIYSTGAAPALVLFDAVPGGAGHCQRLRRRLPELIGAAYSRVANCSCDEQSSCYACIRSYRNQRMHEQLRRVAAVQVLGQLLGY